MNFFKLFRRLSSLESRMHEVEQKKNQLDQIIIDKLRALATLENRHNSPYYFPLFLGKDNPATPYLEKLADKLIVEYREKLRVEKPGDSLSNLQEQIGKK